MAETSVTVVALAALVTALATGLGALPLLATASLSRTWEGVGNAAAAGLMLGASGQLVIEGLDHGLARTLLGVVLGGLFMLFSRRVLPDSDEASMGVLRGADARKALLIVGVMTLHSAAEGIGVGVSFGGGQDLGVLMTAAIAVHNVPEGLAIALVMVPRGATVVVAAGWSVFSSLPQPILAVPAYLFVALFEPVLPVGLGAAAGAMVWMVARELLPDARERLAVTPTYATLALFTAAMLALGWLVAGG
ncbi:Zinc transporter ZupT [Limimonas halophila]|uniref:Zinc transporter ZupT n=1 Tax=Limimonas halophila TaxID=1082479 RepID=A0A1G7UR89_9PROT|nr:ZIP family metal transporter [Limimonas halophila]SDG50024.1 Zinc transporter ZupT [Limimonas halophila]